MRHELRPRPLDAELEQGAEHLAARHRRQHEQRRARLAPHQEVGDDRHGHQRQDAGATQAGDVAHGAVQPVRPHRRAEMARLAQRQQYVGVEGVRHAVARHLRHFHEAPQAARRNQPGQQQRKLDAGDQRRHALPHDRSPARRTGQAICRRNKARA